MAYTNYANARTVSALAGLQDFYREMVGEVVHWRQVRHTRAALNKLSEHELEDIGLARGDIEAIAARGRL